MGWNAPSGRGGSENGGTGPNALLLSPLFPEEARSCRISRDQPGDLRSWDENTWVPQGLQALPPRLLLKESGSRHLSTRPQFSSMPRRPTQSHREGVRRLALAGLPTPHADPVRSPR